MIFYVGLNRQNAVTRQHAPSLLQGVTFGAVFLLSSHLTVRYLGRYIHSYFVSFIFLFMSDCSKFVNGVLTVVDEVIALTTQVFVRKISAASEQYRTLRTVWRIAVLLLTVKIACL